MSEKISYSNAKELLEALSYQGFEVSAPIDVDKIAEKLGIIVIDDTTLQARDSIGEISIENDKPVVRINPLQNSYTPRRRFTLAHEIGHYCLHLSPFRPEFKDSTKTMSRSSSYWDKNESEANGFAAQLIMPKSLLLEKGIELLATYKKNHPSEGMPVSIFVDKMSSLFGASNKAMQYRLKSLKIIA